MIFFYLIRRKCVQKKNGEWKTISCQQTTLRSLLFGKEHDICDCQEKRLQKKFIQKHVSRKLRHNKFINSRSRLVGFSFLSGPWTQRSSIGSSLILYITLRQGLCITNTASTRNSWDMGRNIGPVVC